MRFIITAASVVLLTLSLAPGHARAADADSTANAAVADSAAQASIADSTVKASVTASPAHSAYVDSTLKGKPWPDFYMTLGLGNFQTTNATATAGSESGGGSLMIRIGGMLRPHLGLEGFWLAYSGSFDRPPGYAPGYGWDGGTDLTGNMLGLSAKLVQPLGRWELFARAGAGINSSTLKVTTTSTSCVPPFFCFPSGTTDTKSNDTGPAPIVSGGFEWYRSGGAKHSTSQSFMDGPSIGFGLEGGYLWKSGSFSAFGSDRDLSGWFAEASFIIRARD